MNKIPVFQTVGRSYGYAFAGYFRSLGVIWLPLAAQLALTWYFLQPFLAKIADGGAMAVVFDPQYQRVSFLVQLISFVLLAIVSVGMTKEILGLRRGWRFFYAGFGAAELRVMVGYIALLLLFIVLIVALVLAAAATGAIVTLLAGAMPAIDRRIVGAVAVCLVIGVWLLLFYWMVRLSFLFLPVTVAENRIGIARGWELTRGNFWRIFWTEFLVLLPLIILSITAALLLLGSDYFAFVTEHARDEKAVDAYMMKKLAPLMTNMPLAVIASFVFNPFLYGLIFAPAAFAYRALVPAPAEAMPEPPAADESEPDLPEEVEEVLGPDKSEGH